MASGRWPAAIAIAAGLALAVVALVRPGDDGERPAPAPTAVQPRPDPLSYPRQGVRLLRPPRWTADLRRGVVHLRAPDGTTSVALTSDDREVRPDDVRRSAARVARQGLALAHRTGRTKLLLGGLEAAAEEYRGRSRRGLTVDVVVSAARGRHRTYGVTIVKASNAPPQRLREVALVLRSLRLHRPRR